MAERFRFKLLTGVNPDQQYADIGTTTEGYNSYTFYLLKNGKGYLGSQKLFDASESIELIQSITGDGTETDAASTKAIVDYVKGYVEDALDTVNVISSKFFRKVVSHTLTQDDIDNDAISKPAGVAVGDVGLLFTADTDETDDGDEAFYFVSLKNYLSTVYTFGNSNSITMSVGEDNQVTASLKIKQQEGFVNPLKVDNGGVYVETVETVNDENPGNGLVTEKALTDYIENQVVTAVEKAMKDTFGDAVTWSEDPPQAGNEPLEES